MSSRGSAASEFSGLVKHGSLIVIAFAFVKAYGVARFSLTTTAALVTSSPLSTTVGIVAIYTYVLAPALAFTVLWVLYLSWRRAAEPWYQALLVVLVVAVLLSPPQYLAAAAVMFVVSVAVHRAAGAWQVRLADEGARPRLARVLTLRHQVPFHAVVVFVAATAMATLDTPWLPAEVLHLRTQVDVSPRDHLLTNAPTVYVLSEGNGELTVLEGAHRYVLHIPSADVLERVVCHDEGSQLPGANALLKLGTDYHSPNLACWRYVARWS